MLAALRVLPFAVFALSILGAAACGSDASSPEPALPADEIEAVPFSTTKMLSAADVAELTVGIDGTLSFRNAPAILATIEVGEVIVAGISPSTPQGLIRVVTDVRRNGASLELSTMHSPLQLAFRKLHMKIERDVADFTTAGAAVPNDVGPRTVHTRVRPQGDVISANPSATLPLDFVLFDGDGDSATTNDQIAIKGSLGGGIRFGMSLDVDWDQVLDLPSAVKTCLKSLAATLIGKPPDCSLFALLPEVKVGFHADPHMEAAVKVEGSASFSYEKKFDLATITITPFAVGPLVFVPSVDITARVEGGAAAGFIVGAHGGIELTTGVTISSKHVASPDIVPLGLKKADFKADDTQVTLAAHAKAGVGARLNLQLYGIVGPYAEALAYAEVKADFVKNPCWDLHVGLEGALGVKVTSPVLPFIGSVSLLDWRSPPFVAIDETLTSGSCKPNPKGPQLPPGSGPDAPTYATPTFTQWTRAWAPTGNDGSVHTLIHDDREWTDLALAIDNRYVTVGHRSDTVVKFDDVGSVLWSRRYRRDALAPVMNVTRVANTADAALMLLTEANDGEGPGLLKVGQAGGVYFRKRLAMAPETGCSLFPKQLVRDAGSGFYILGECTSGAKAVLIHVDADGALLSSRVFSEPGGARSLLPTAIAVSSTGDVILVGTSSTTTEGVSMFAMRVTDAGAVKWANRYVGCDGYKDLSPTSARIDANDGVTLSGSASDHRVGLLARLKSDGALAFANFPGLGTYSTTPLAIHGMAELPTTGFLVAGSTTNLDAAVNTPEATGSIFVESLDAIGRPLWTKSYRLANNRTTAFAGIRLTDDGGAVVAGVAEHVGTQGGGLFAMKVFAKDGELGQAAKDAGITVTTIPTTSPTCAVGTVAWNVGLSDATTTLPAATTLSETATVQ
jgi:hypothetical protein